MNGPAGTSGPPGHFYVAVASRMVIPQSLNIEQVAIILMKAKKALQQLQFQWVVLNRPTSGIGFVMFWDGNELADDGYNWMNRGRTDTIPTHQKSISIEATRFFDGYIPGEKTVSMTKTFYRFAGQQTSLYFVHYISHPIDGPKKPAGPAIPTVKPTMKPTGEMTIAAPIASTSPRPNPGQLPRGRPRTATPPLQVPQNVIHFPSSQQQQQHPLQPQLRTNNVTQQQSKQPPLQPLKASPTTIRLALQNQQQQQRASPRRQSKYTQASQQAQQQQPIADQVTDVIADFDSWSPVDHAVNRLTRMEAFYQKLFSMTTGLQKPTTNRDLIKQGNAELKEALTEQLKRTKESVVHEDEKYKTTHDNDNDWSAFAELDKVSTPEELIRFARLHNIDYKSL